MLPLDRPQIMGILNLTPDSFSDGGKYLAHDAALSHVEQMLEEGADMIDIGGYSSRPYADFVSATEERNRIETIIASILERFPSAILSLDTYRPSVAKPMLDLGVHIINDISAGSGMGEEGEAQMMELIASYEDVPYVCMHMQGNPSTMQDRPDYQDVNEEVWDFFVKKIGHARSLGIKDFILDPGFGFGKTLLHNYQLLANLDRFTLLDVPILVGISRKSMLYKLLQTSPDQVLEAASALHLKCLESGAHILRTHDIKAARHIRQLFTYLGQHGII